MMRSIRLILLACLGLALGAAPYAAEAKEAKAVKARPASSPAAPERNKGELLEVSAEQSLEWYQDTRLYVARGQAKAERGAMMVEADLLTAHQRDPKAQPKPEKKSGDKNAQMGGGDIDQLMAEGNVKISDPKQQVFGDKAVYDLDRGIVKITGDNLKYVTEKNVVTAKDSLEYFESDMTAVARGRAIATHEDNRVESDVLSAKFAHDAAGQMDMTQMVAKGNVMILTKDGGLSRGDQAVYDVKRNVAILTGHVRVARGETQLAGDKAEVDFATGQSRLINSGTGRVRALISSTAGKSKP